MPIPKLEIPHNVWDAAIAKLLAGEISRKECAASLGMAYSTFVTRLNAKSRADVNARIRHASSGLNNVTAKEDPERHQRYLDAVAHAVKFGSIRAAADKFGVNYQVLGRKVREAKEAQQ